MLTSKRKRSSNPNVGPNLSKVRSNDDDDDEETASDSDSGSEETANNKHHRNRRQLRASTNGYTNNTSGTTQSEDDDEWKSDDDAPLFIPKKRSKYHSKHNKMLAEAIISNKQNNGKKHYLIKWKDGSETWETQKKTKNVCPDILREYIEESLAKWKKDFEVEAIVSHRTNKARTKYLIKWKDHSKGETWETEFRAKQCGPELMAHYVQEMEATKTKAMEVEEIVEYKMFNKKRKYLIKWKDHSRGETWETARKTISLCPDIFDEFIKDRPEAIPPADCFNPFRWSYKETEDKPKRNRHLFGPKKLSDEESDESTEWEVERIVKHKIKNEENWEFLIRWKGCTAKYDTWEAEENLNCPDILSKYLAEVAEPVWKQTDGNSKQLTAGKKKKKKRSLKPNVGPKLSKVRSNDDDDDEETASDSVSGSEETANNKHHRNRRQLRASTNGYTSNKSGTTQSEDDDEWESDDDTPLFIPKKRSKYNKMLAEAIISNKRNNGKKQYLIKWKDGSETWETQNETKNVCPDILREYIEESLVKWKKLSDEESDESTEWEVERIVKHRIKNEENWEFLIRWKGCTAKDDTWEAEENLNCPDLLSKYLAEVAEPVRKQTDGNSKPLTAGNKKKKKRSSNPNVGPNLSKVRSNDDDDDEETASDSDSGSEETANNKHHRNRRQLRASTNGYTNNTSGTTQSEDDDEWKSDDDAPLFIPKKRSKYHSKHNKMLAEAIISNKQNNGKKHYLIKWKDGSETWETQKKTKNVCPDILREYIEESLAKWKKDFEVEAIVSHRTNKARTKYLIKWKDHSKGETWETEFRAKQCGPELMAHYVQEIEAAETKAMEVEAIVEHKMFNNHHKYLIKWKDPSKGKTWETARKTISLCPDILDEFIKDRPEANPPADLFNPFSWSYKETKDKPKRNRHLFGRKKLSDEESDESTEWEVERIVKHRIKNDENWEFLIRWKGCTAKDDTWEAEENLNCPDILSKYLAEVAEPVWKQTNGDSKQLTAGKQK